MPRHLIALLKEVRPKRALFTTFTFNLPFFDAAVLPAASRGDGCEVSVLVDARQLARSITGTFSRAAGIRYALAGVQAPGGGFFHPKIAFLETDDDQFLCVGSGNLTVSGLSRQLESWDITRCSEAPGVLNELAAFLTTLATDTEASSKRASSILKKTASRVSLLFKPVLPTNRSDVRLIHSMVEPVSSQLIELFRERESVAKQLTVLSPFHSDGGGPVRRLAKEVRAEKVRIGHDGTARFEKAWYAALLGPRGYVVAKPEGSRGTGGELHAKVFELRGAEHTLVMTGSVNATARSLESKRNVEVAIARWGAKSPFRWQAADPELFVAAEMPDMEGDILFLEASLEDGTCLAGALSRSGTSDLPATIGWSLMEAEMLREHGAVAVSSDGLFQVRLSEAVPMAHLALTLEIVAGDLTATTWVNDERALHATARGARRSKPLERALHGVATLQDFSYIEGLLWQASQARSARKPAVHAAPGGAAKLEAPELTKPFSYDAWLRSGIRDHRPTKGGERTDLYSAVLSLLFPKAIESESGEDSNEVETPKKIVLGETDDGESAKEAEEEKPKKRRSSPQRSHIDGLAHMVLRASIEIQRAFSERRPEMDDPETLALVGSAHELEKLQRRWREWSTKFGLPAFADWDYQRSFVLWLEALSGYPWDEDSRESLLPVVTCLCCLAAYCLALPGATPRFAKLAILRTFLDRMAARELRREEVLRLAETGLSDEIFSRLEPEVRALVGLCAPQLGSSVRLDVELLAEIADAIRVDVKPKKSHPTFPVLYSGVPRNPRLSRAVEVISDRDVREGGCPICGQTLNDDEREQLRFRRVLRHPGNPTSTNAHVILYPHDAVVFRNSLVEFLR
ncbi:MAG: hypothetical protein HY020_07075 [Burkholderiales bacterium]|nr:hypothetical protein [Burkholderiales bacterium]